MLKPFLLTAIAIGVLLMFFVCGCAAEQKNSDGNIILTESEITLKPVDPMLAPDPIEEESDADEFDALTGDNDPYAGE